MKKCTQLILALTVLITTFSLNLALVHGQNLEVATPPINPAEDKLVLPGTSGSDQGQFIQNNFLPNVTRFIIGLAGGLSLLFVIISGIQILSAFGNEEQISSAKKTITWALGGLIISILSYAIVQAIISIRI